MKKDDVAFVFVAAILAVLFIKLPFIGGGLFWALIAYVAN